MLTHCVTLSGIVLCCTDIEDVQLVSLTTSLHTNWRETTVSSNLFTSARQKEKKSDKWLTKKGKMPMMDISTSNWETSI